LKIEILSGYNIILFMPRTFCFLSNIQRAITFKKMSKKENNIVQYLLLNTRPIIIGDGILYSDDPALILHFSLFAK
jgi:hypothetical protein